MKRSERMKKKYGFLILHYKVISETENAVESILSQNFRENYEIMIVDNGSGNDSGLKLKEEYLNCKNIHVIINDENVGFARGNNVGFKILKEKFACDFIIMINSDIKIIDEDFLRLIDDEYNESNFSVLGPMIILPNGNIDNCETKMPNIKQLKRNIFKNRIIILLNYINVYNLIVKIVKKINPNIYVKKDKKDKRLENVVLHGCCLIFSEKYITKFDGLDDRTFLYYEEQLLFNRLKKNNMLSVYNPNIKVIHNESATTKTITKNLKKKNIFMSKNLIKSAKILINELRN